MTIKAPGAYQPCEFESVGIHSVPFLMHRICQGIEQAVGRIGVYILRSFPT